ncbi:hypothetical protein F5884DRAFT_823017 [Xylogone sp. PMI_703]|nr:hypothetical protein F5884DRAFT_823017 [Xylogone sp. PMI_703]
MTLSEDAPMNGNHEPRFPYPQTGSDRNYEIPKSYHSQKTRIRVACVGAGPTGLALAFKMERQMGPGTWDLTLYEKNPAIGGTWYENKQIYTYSWDPNPDWSTYFAYGPEILEYFKKFSGKHDLQHYVQLNTQVVSATWFPQEGIYKILLRNSRTGEQREDWSHILVNATGNLNKWKWPNIEGLHSFAGPMMHSARWDESVDFKDKVVGVIGTGSTAIQIVPQLQKVSKKLSLFMRSPTWISPPFGGGVLREEIKHGHEGDMSHRQYTFSNDEKRLFHEKSDSHLELRQKIEAEINLNFGLYIKETDLQKKTLETMKNEMERRIGPGHEELKKHLIPSWLPGCRRITPGDGYLEALVKDNVRCVFKNIRKITPEGTVDSDGVLHKLDILICATGFDVPYIPHFKVINGKGVNMQDAWHDSPNLYLGITAPDYPNYFVTIGPGGTWSNGTILPALETACEHFIQIFKKMQEEGIKSIEVTQEACDDFLYHMDKFHENTVWADNCSSWFKKNGRVWVWPGATIHYLKTLHAPPRYEDYKFTYWKGRRFAYLGDGSVKAMHGKDFRALAPYIRNSDTAWSIE